MKRSDVVPYWDKKIRIIVGSSKTFFTGTIKELHEDNLVLLDKFNKRITIVFSDIVSIWEVD